MEAYLVYQRILLAVAGIGCASLLLWIVARSIFPHVAAAYEALGRSRLRTIFLVGTALATLYGGSKGFLGTISFPRTDPEVWYLLNNGSYVTNDAVHVAYVKSPTVPDSAWLYVDGCDHSITNDDRWTTSAFTAYSNTISAAGLSFDVSHAAATNFDWIVYTTWTPSPVVHTNGVAYIAWQVGPSTNNLVLYRTGVYTNNALRVAPNPAITNSPTFPITVNLGESNED